MRAETPTKTFGVAAVLLLGASSLAQSASVFATRSTDNVLQGNFETGASDTFLPNNSNARRVGSGGAGDAQRVNQPVLGFTLPTLGAGQPVTAATFSFTMDAVAVNGSPTFDVVISLMSQTSTAGFSEADFTEDVGALGSGTLVATLAVGDVSNNEEKNFALSGAALTQFAALYDGAGAPTQAEVFFRLSTSETIDTSAASNVRFNLARNDDGGGNLVTRSLEITTVPEPSSFGLLGLGALGLLARRR